jgi:hypothetical protein
VLLLVKAIGQMAQQKLTVVVDMFVQGKVAQFSLQHIATQAKLQLLLLQKMIAPEKQQKKPAKLELIQMAQQQLINA